MADRKCAGCGKILNRNNMIKITKQKNAQSLVVNGNSKIFGRSVYLCYNNSCIEAAFKKGCKFDSWTEYFSLEKWLETFKECGIDPDFYTVRRREYDEIMPWEHLDYGVSKSFLISENKAAHAGVTTPNCREKCSACGAARYGEGVCFEKR